MKNKDLISKFPFIADTSDEGLARLQSASIGIDLEPREPVLSPGDKISGADLVVSGSLRVYYNNSQGREGTLYWIDPGQSCILAMNCLFSDLDYPAWVECDEKNTHVISISGDVYRALFQSEKHIQEFTFETMSSQLFSLMSLLEESSSHGLEQRTAAFLLRRSSHEQKLDTTHENVARHLGSSREVVSRVLRGLARKGVIELQKGCIVIIDVNQLAELSGNTFR